MKGGNDTSSARGKGATINKGRKTAGNSGLRSHMAKARGAKHDVAKAGSYAGAPPQGGRPKPFPTTTVGAKGNRRSSATGGQANTRARMPKTQVSSPKITTSGAKRGR